MIPLAKLDVPVNDEMKASFNKHGLVTIPRITTDEEASWFRDVYDRLLVDRLARAFERPGGPQGQATNTLWFQLDASETVILERTTLCRNALALAAGLLEVDESAITMGLRVFFKPAGGGGPVPWHQDEAHHDPAFDHSAVNVWVPFDVATEQNGCLWYIPGSHLGEVRVHRHPGYGAPEVALMTDDVRDCDAVAVPLPAAGASVHHCRTVHSSGTNSTDQHRRALVAICTAPPRRRSRPAERPWLKGSHHEGHPPEISF